MSSIPSTLAKTQLKQNRKRTFITMLGIILSVAMLTAVCGLAASGIDAMRNLVGDKHMASYSAVFISMAVVLGSIIMAASIVVISGAFRISASERMRQFGILKSVGATRRQIVKTMLHEALYYALIAIPTGVVIGLLIEWLGTTISDVLLAPMNKLLVEENASLHMRFIFSWQSVIIAILTSLATVLLSAWLPARKAAKIPAIEAIKLTHEIKVRQKQLKTTKLIQTIFGFEGTLAAKAIKRSRRSYRAMVTALAISIILFLVCGSLDTLINMSMNQLFANVDANSYTTFSSNSRNTEYYNKPLDAASMEKITQAFREYPDTTIFALGLDDNYRVSVEGTALSDTMLKTLEEGQSAVSASLVMLDQMNYEALCKTAGVPVGSNILINSKQKNINEKTSEFQPLNFSGQTLTLTKHEESTTVALDAQVTGTQVPQEMFAAEDDLVIIVPACQADLCYWFGNSEELPGFLTYAEETMASFFPLSEDSNSFVYNVADITAITNMTRSLSKLISLLLYGFVAMLTLIGLTSVISAISANVRLRSREFAVLQSAGMTQSGIRRMLALESIMSSLKALLYGLPIGSVAVFLTYKALTQGISFQFVFPWATLLEVVLGVFLITLITTQYAASKLRSGNLVETIRAGEGV